ncbi:MAG TPA: SH3 domain-containing protein [Candidatus Limnocylindrales bacterium]|nr:SH3 domain-containing protein [Candidatus Limnocylindrales bacterium]
MVRAARLFLLLTAALLWFMLPARAQDGPTPVPTVGTIATLASPPPALPTATLEPSPRPTYDPATCGQTLEALYIYATEACLGKSAGYVCSGTTPPDALRVEPQGAVSASLTTTGSLIEVSEIDSLQTPALALENNVMGLVFVRPADPLNYSAMLLGEGTLTDASPPEFPPWTSLIVATSPTVPDCPAAPVAALVLQGSPGVSTRIVVNGASLQLNGTVLVRASAEAASTTFIGLAGASSVLTFGSEQALWAGLQLSVPSAPGDLTVTAGPPSLPAPLDPAQLANLPVALFERPLQLPQPGVTVTQGAVNLRTAPTTDAAVIVQAPPGETLAVLGQSTDGLWLNVRRQNGDTGWMLAELLARNLGPISATYAETPLPPQRLGDLGSRARVRSASALRTGPDLVFPALTAVGEGQTITLLQRSPYSPWVKVDANGAIGWMPLLGLETAAFIDALPVDYGAPPLPTPTTIPGSFGNAFPDPNNPGS